MPVLETIDLSTYNVLLIASVIASAIAYTRHSTNVALGFTALLSFLTAWSSFLVQDSNGNFYAAYSLFGIVFAVNGILAIINLIIRIVSGGRE